MPSGRGAEVGTAMATVASGSAGGRQSCKPGSKQQTQDKQQAEESFRAYHVVQKVRVCDGHLQRRDAAAEGSHRLVGNAGEEVQLLATILVRPQVPPARRPTRGSRFGVHLLPGLERGQAKGKGKGRTGAQRRLHAVTAVSAGTTTSGIQ